MSNTTYESWRISYQSSEAAARAAYDAWQKTEKELEAKCGALKEVISCIDAATAEGLDDALVNNTDAHLADLVQRRLLPAFYTAISASQPNEEESSAWSAAKARVYEDLTLYRKVIAKRARKAKEKARKPTPKQALPNAQPAA